MASPQKDSNLHANEHLLMKEKRGSHDKLDIEDSDVADNGRHTWSKRLEYFLTIIGFSVGLGNVWRFPYVCIRNGGGAFLIPFLLVLFIIVFPIYFLETALGQFVGKSVWHAWEITPLFRGIGLSMNILCLMACWHYCTILAWSLVYMVNSFKSPLPWTQCGQSWNTENCITPEGFRSINRTPTIQQDLLNKTVTNVTVTSGNDTAGVFGNNTGVNQTLEEALNTNYVTATKEFWLKLLELQTWSEATLQVFYSLGPAWGALLTMASYNKFDYNCLKDSVILVCICEGTSIFGGFATFSILGHMAYVAKVPIIEFAKSGAGLVFIVYPEAVSYLPLPQLWGFLFFLMIFTLGLDSQFTNVETVITTIVDLYPRVLYRWRTVTTIITMVVLTLCSLVFTTKGGFYLFQIVDWYIAAFSVLSQAVLECVCISWIYGADRFCYDIQLMIGRRPPYFLVLAWKFICPILLLILFCMTLASYVPPVIDGYTFPVYAQAIGWFIAVLPFSSIVFYAVYKLTKYEGMFLQRLKASCKPPPDWGPSNPEARRKYNYEPEKTSHVECKLPCGKV